MKLWWQLNKGEKKKRSRIGWILIAVIILFMWIGSTTSSENTKKAPLEAEIGELGNTFVRVINRNDYDWHNVTITVNSYYSCWKSDLLKPGEAISVNAPTCSGFVPNHNAISLIEISTEEGKTSFNR